jgi:hypothetical protein
MQELARTVGDFIQSRAALQWLHDDVYGEDSWRSRE